VSVVQKLSSAGKKGATKKKGRERRIMTTKLRRKLVGKVAPVPKTRSAREKAERSGGRNRGKPRSTLKNYGETALMTNARKVTSKEKTSGRKNGATIGALWEYGCAE